MSLIRPPLQLLCALFICRFQPNEPMKESVRTITGGLQAGVLAQDYVFLPFSCIRMRAGLLGNTAFILGKRQQMSAHVETPESKSARVFILMFLPLRKRKKERGVGG